MRRSFTGFAGKLPFSNDDQVSRHNNVMQFLEVSKKLSKDLTRALHVLEKKLFSFCFKYFFYKRT